MDSCEEIVAVGVGRLQGKGKGHFSYIKMHSCGFLYLMDVEVRLYYHN